MNYQLLHGGEIVRYWKPETVREKYLLAEFVELFERNEVLEEEAEELEEVKAKLQDWKNKLQELAVLTL
jgi:hypothetical protein